MAQLLYKGRPISEHDVHAQIPAMLIMMPSFASHMVARLFVPAGMTDDAKEKFCDIYKEFFRGIKSAENQFAATLIGNARKNEDNPERMMETTEQAYMRRFENYTKEERIFREQMELLAIKTGIDIPERYFTWER